MCGKLLGVPVVAMEGRFHAYEGYSYQQITFPVRVMRALGAELLIVSNACGGMNPQYAPGDIMVIEDHINLMSGNPLGRAQRRRAGAAVSRHGRPYDRVLIDRALEIARRENFVAHAACTWPSPARTWKRGPNTASCGMIGADVVGMSTVPEVLVAVHAGMQVLGLSIVTDLCLPDALQPADIDDILATAAAAEPKLRKIVLGILAHEAGKAA